MERVFEFFVCVSQIMTENALLNLAEKY